MQISNLPTKIPLPFAASGTKNVIPTASQIGITPGAASLTDGFPPLTFTPIASGGVPPAGADFNGIFNLTSSSIQWLNAGGGFPYDATFSTAIGGYPQGAIIPRVDQTGFWLNQVDNNTTNPETGGANWVPAYNYGTTAVAGLTNANVTLTALQASKNAITLAGTLTGNVQIIFPTWIYAWRVINNTTGAFTVTCKTASGTGIVVAQGGVSNLYGDGTNIGQLSLSQTSADARYAQLAGSSTQTFAVSTLAASGAISANGANLFPNSHLNGATLSTAGSSATMSIAAGMASDSTNTVLTALSAIAKTTSAWAVGTSTGGLDTGSIANSTWYYFYMIRRPDTGVVDVVFSTNSSTPTLPTNYTQYRYIGAGLTNGSAQWTKFTQAGDEFYWDTPVLDFTGAGSTTAVLLTCTVPRGRKVKPYFNIEQNASGTPGMVYLSDPSNADLAPSSTVAPLAATYSGTGSSINGNQANVWTNTSAQIRYRCSDTATFRLATLGWIDLRGKDL